MSKRKGFTLVELLAVIVILAIILVIAVPKISNLISSVQTNAYKSNEQMLIRAAKSYIGVNDSYLPVNIGNTREITLNTLQTNNYISTIKSPEDNTKECDGYVLITKTGASNYEYTSHLDCVNGAGSLSEDGLIGYWKLNNGQAWDYSPSTNNGTLNGATAVTDRFGNPNGAMEFNALTDYINFRSNTMHGLSNFTYSTWYDSHLAHMSGLFSTEMGITWRFTSFDDYFRLRDNSGNTYDIYLGPVQLNTWTHIAIVYDNINSTRTDVSVYRNGELFSVTSTSGNIMYSDMDAFKIGRTVQDGYEFDGAIDDIRLYNRPLSSGEVKNIYDMEKN